MTGSTYRYASVRQLAAVVERVAPRDPAVWEGREPAPAAGGLLVPVSRERARQLWALVGMFDRAVGSVPHEDLNRRSARRLFEPGAVGVFWDLAEAGQLRFRARDVGKPLPVASLRIVRDCLGIVARLVVPDRQVLLPVVDPPELKDTVDGRSRAALYRGLVDLAADGPLERDGMGLTRMDRTRLLAMVAVVLDTGTRSGELAALRMDDLADGLEAVAVRRRPQRAASRVEDIAYVAEVHPRTVQALLAGQLEKASEAVRQRVLAAAAEVEGRPDVQWYGLREGTRVAVRRWLDVRQEILDGMAPAANEVPIEGGRSALWVTVHASSTGPAGVTILPDGLRRAYTRGITALNAVMAGQYGWSPLPTTMEQLRRAVDVEPLAGAPTQ